MLDIVAEVNRMVQNGNTSALFSPVNEYDWVSSDQVILKYILPPICAFVDGKESFTHIFSSQVFIGKDPLTALTRGDFKRVSKYQIC